MHMKSITRFLKFFFLNSFETSVVRTLCVWAVRSCWFRSLLRGKMSAKAVAKLCFHFTGLCGGVFLGLVHVGSFLLTLTLGIKGILKFLVKLIKKHGISPGLSSLNHEKQ